MKIALSQLDPIIGDIQGNSQKIQKDITKAVEANCSLIVFPELAICGYPPDDLLDYPFFIDQCLHAVHQLAADNDNIAIIIGGIDINKGKGRKLYNSAFVIINGKIEHVVHKTLLPTYDIFSESRYFEPNHTFKLIEIGNTKIAITICEDIWDKHNNFKYKLSPIDELAKLKPNLHINICASPYGFEKYPKRKQVINDAISRLNCPMVYLNQAAAHTGILFDGDSGFYDTQCQKIADLAVFESDFKIIETEDVKVISADSTTENNLEVLKKGLIFGIKSYFKKMGFSPIATLGSSGGIDSAVIQYLASEALGAENVLAVLMPSEYSSKGSITDAEQLSKTLGNPYQILPIKKAYDSFLDILDPIFKDTPFSVAEENIQARARGLILMAISNKTGRFLLNTSNKSEIAVGYTTLYGDMCGGLSPIGDVYKTLLYDLAKHINKVQEIIPWNIINKPPSAELRPNQKDSDSLPDYPILDGILKLHIEGQLGKKEIIAAGFEEKTVERVVNLVNRNDYKRWQAAPVLKITSKDFSYGRKMPLVAKHT